LPGLDPHVAKITKLSEEAAAADNIARAAHERRDSAVRDAITDGWSPKKLHRALVAYATDRYGIPLSEPSLYRIRDAVA
jgi:hypothetical protein